MIDMARKNIIPAVNDYIKDLTKTATLVRGLSPEVTCYFGIDIVKKLTLLANSFVLKVKELEQELKKAGDIPNCLEQAKYFSNEVFGVMKELRKIGDEIEVHLGEKYLPYPTYGELLFSV